ncbi:MAG: CxxxxCH/CxxCH domain-containing protein [Deltaproteobacteria bacterium]|nr:CxxxxCH/CxxCH domain-containing protein [Deltaproteobacteria bacterium]
MVARRTSPRSSRIGKPRNGGGATRWTRRGVAAAAVVLVVGSASALTGNPACTGGTPHEKHISQFQCGVCHPRGDTFGFDQPYTFPGGTTTAGGTIVLGSPGTPTTCVVACHSPGSTTGQPVTWETLQAPLDCTSCHDTSLLPPTHPRVSPTSKRADCTGCHGTANHLGGTVTIVGHSASWSDPNSLGFHAYEANRGLVACTACHGPDLGGDGNAVSCAQCHDQGLPAGVTSWKTNCVMCHGGVDNGTGAPPKTTWGNDGDPVRVGAHTRHLGESAIAPSLGCSVCHPKPLDALSADHVGGPTATMAFSGLAVAQGSPQPTWDRTEATCSNTYCHGGSLAGGTNSAPVWTAVGQGQAACGACHGLPPPAPHPTLSGSTGCATCHPDTVDAGGTIIPPSAGGKHLNGNSLIDGSGGSHPLAAPGSGPVTLFADTGHDDAGWIGDKPYFAVLVDCTTCHTTQLAAAHGNDCATCHPALYDTLGVWNKGCQQGGCHSTYHEDSTKAHLPFEDAYDPGNDCSRCHSQGMAVPQSSCLNCHAAYVPGDVTPPITNSNVWAEYIGPAKVDFSITDQGKVGLGRTFYRLDGGPVTAAGKNVFIAAPGLHGLEFWSRDQAGNTESAPKNVAFRVVEDTVPPSTTSNAQATYYQSPVITLTATDASTLGVKSTYYRLDNGPVQTGTSVVVPTVNATTAHSLTFWSEDWSGNLETPKTVNFTVMSGNGTLRLVWGASDAAGSPCPGDPEARATWTIRQGDASGPVVASGGGGCPNWSGVDDVAVPVGLVPYFVMVYWWDSVFGFFDQTPVPNVSLTMPGQVVPLRY